jgi:predicted ATPase
MLSDEHVLALIGDVGTNREYLAHLVDQISTTFGVLPFIGAGMSASFKFPAWDAFLLRAAREVNHEARTRDLLHTYQYEEAASEVFDRLGARRAQDLMEQTFGDHLLEGKPVAGALCQLRRLPEGPIVTTNFDRVLEKVFEREKPPLLPFTYLEADRGIEALQQNKRFLLKLHGDWENPKSRVLTLTEYAAAYGSSSTGQIHFGLHLPTLLKQLLSGRCCLFLGCSLKQDRTMQILATIARENHHILHYALVNRPAADDAFQQRARELSNLGIRPVWLPAGAYDLVEPVLEYLVDKAIAGLGRLVRKLQYSTGKDVPNNIPGLTNKTIGRGLEIAQVSTLLRTTSMLTITGPGGCGKSRLAIEVAAQIKPDFEDGVFYISLAELGAEADREGTLAPRVGRILGVVEAAGRPPHVSLAEHISDKRVLLVLDNCESALKSCRAVITYLLPRCPNLTVLATSRRPLDNRDRADSRVEQERLYPLAPLATPDEEVTSLEAIAGTESVALFVERARERNPTWQLASKDVPAVAELCRALDGIPLAIEVAAARFSVKSLDQLATESSNLMTALGQLRGGDLRRWKTLTAALKWSYGLLTHRQQSFMRAMSVFNGGWTEEAAAAVYAHSSTDHTSVTDYLEVLSANSLLVGTEANGVRRFRFLEPIRQMADAQLSPEERDSFARAHALHFLNLAEVGSPELLKSQQSFWLDRLQSDVDNFRAVFRWCVKNREAEHGLRLIGVLWRFAEIRGYLTEGRARARDVLAIDGVEHYPVQLVKALSGAGMLAYRQADFEAARQMFGRVLEITTQLNLQQERAMALNDLGNVALMQAHFDLAKDFYNDALKAQLAAGTPRDIAVAKFNVGSLATAMGNYDTAEPVLSQSLEEFRAEGNERDSAFPLNTLAQIAIAKGNLGLATDQAIASYDIRKKLGDSKGAADSQRTVAWALIQGGDFENGKEKLSESIRIARSLRDARGLAESLELFGLLYDRLRKVGRAVEALGAAEHIRSGNNYALPPVRAQLRQAVLSDGLNSLGELEYERAWKRGFASNPEDAVERACAPDMSATAASAR